MRGFHRAISPRCRVDRTSSDIMLIDTWRAKNFSSTAPNRVGADAGKRGFVDVQADAHAAAVDDRPRRRASGGAWARSGRGAPAICLRTTGSARLPYTVSICAQRLRARVLVQVRQAQVVQAQVADQVPGGGVFGQRGMRPRRAVQHLDGAPPAPISRSVRSVCVPSGQQHRQVAVGAQRIQGQVPQAARRTALRGDRPATDTTSLPV